MNQIKMKLSIDTDNAVMCAAASVFFTALANLSDINSKVKASKVEDLKKVEKPVLEVIKEVEKFVVDEPEAEVKKITKTMVKALLAKKKEINPEAIKVKLTELGVPNVAKLELSKCAEFYKFLEDIEPVVIVDTSNEAEEVPEETPKVTMIEVRALMGKKVDKNRPVIKAELNRLGVSNLPTLGDEKLPKFYEFLKGLE